jgi:membrane associated rhomboid family serine protease
MGIAAATILASLFAHFTVGDDHAAIIAGFIPGRASMGFDGDFAGLVPVILTPLSATLVHGGWMHLLSNMVMLGYLGFITERAIGSRGILILYLVGAYFAAVAQWLPDPSSPVPMVGASGAIAAILGASALLYGKSKARDIGPVPAWLLHRLWLLAAWVVVNFAFGLVLANAGIGIAVAAHIGGFIAGLILCRPLLLWRWRGA